MYTRQINQHFLFLATRHKVCGKETHIELVHLVEYVVAKSRRRKMHFIYKEAYGPIYIYSLLHRQLGDTVQSEKRESWGIKVCI